MKKFVHSIARKNRHLESLLILASKTKGALRTHGLRHTAWMALRKLRLIAHSIHRRRLARALGLPGGWPKFQIPSRLELKHRQYWIEREGYRPSITLVLPVSNESPAQVKDTLKGIARQIYPAWQLIIIRASSKGHELDAFAKSDSRIQVISAPMGHLPIEALNHAIALSQADYCGVIHPGDRLTTDALFQVARALEEAPETDVVYTDEVHVEPGTNQMEGQFYKPAFSPEMLLGYNYIGSLCLIRRSLLNEVGGYHRECRAAQEWDLLLRLMEAGCHFERVPRCCYLRRTDLGQTPFGTARADTAADYVRVLDAHLSRQGVPARAEVSGNGTLRIRFSLTNPPLVSIIIPNKNSLNLIRNLVDDLLHKTSYPNREIIIVDNQSTDPLVHKFYQEQTQAGHLRVVPFNQDFNYSAACNAGRRAARGEYLLFLNNDMEVIAPDWLEDLVGWASLPKTGVVGTKLHYANGHIQHAGVMIGLFFVSHIWHKLPKAQWGIFGTPDSYRNFLAVTGACQMISKRLFDELGGYDEQFQLAFSDVMLCLKAREKGLRVVYTPFASLIHHESLSRGNNTPIPDFQRFASDFRGMGLNEDPHFHPELNARSFNPVMRGMLDPGMRDNLKQQLDFYDPPTDHFETLNWFDDGTMLHQAALWGLSFPLPRYSPANVHNSLSDAKQFILYVRRKFPELRERFPLGLSSGADGEFCRWLCEEGVNRFRLPDGSADRIREAFQSLPGARIRQLYAFSHELRRVYPTAFLPTGQKQFLHWVLLHGRPEHQFPNEDIWWMLLEASEDPARELEWTYRGSQEWQQLFPAGLTAFGSEKLLAWLGSRHRLQQPLLESIESRISNASLDDVRFAYWKKPDWRVKFPNAFRDVAETRELLAWVSLQTGITPQATSSEIESACQRWLGLNVLGHFCYPSGLQQSVRSLVRSLEMEHVAVSLRDTPAHYNVDDPNRKGYLGLETHEVSLIHVQPLPDMDDPYFERVYSLSGLDMRDEVYRIGYWYWELEEVPSTWKPVSEMVQELWAPTEFIANAMTRALSVKVTPMLPGVEVGNVEPVSREELGVEKGQFLFLFMFDMKSMMERKNPLGLIEAYQRAFRREDRARLIVKVSSGHFFPEELVRLQAAAKEAGVILMDEVLSREKSYGLIQACDCYISLHRSEGLGLTMAEAMLLSKPVIATGYSGNMDFMNPSISMLVDYQLRQLRGTCPDYVYRVYKDDAFWAHPSVEHAATWMRWAYEHPEDAKALGIAAHKHAKEVLSPEAAGRRLKARLEEISAELARGRNVQSVKFAA